MTEEDRDVARSQAARDILDELGEIKQRLARLERLVEQIALGMGISAHG